MTSKNDWYLPGPKQRLTIRVLGDALAPPEHFLPEDASGGAVLCTEPSCVFCDLGVPLVSASGVPKPSRGHAGFTLLELLIVVAILLLCVTVAVAIIQRRPGPSNRANAEAQARAFAAFAYPNREARALCQPEDTDRNGYVSCTLVVGTDPPVAIECANVYAVSNEGCRLARPIVPTVYGR